uniref:REST corepressor 1-like isoform X2 n=1 Tax=Myxine glutinosa TaxID=7769 RepID=UPI00358FB647
MNKGSRCRAKEGIRNETRVSNRAGPAEVDGATQEDARSVREERGQGPGVERRRQGETQGAEEASNAVSGARIPGGGGGERRGFERGRERASGTDRSAGKMAERRKRQALPPVLSSRSADGTMRVGSDYQATIPDYQPDAPPRPNEKEVMGMLVWSPQHNIPEAKLEEYITIAKEKHGYNVEQALGMLLWHKHSVERSFIDLANFTPFPDEWTVEDRVLFEQAFSFHGKSFHRIQQMLPDKSIGSLVRYYYGWKKTRSRTSLMDRQARRFASKREDRCISEALLKGDEDPEARPVEGSVKPREVLHEPKTELGGETWAAQPNHTVPAIRRDVALVHPRHPHHPHHAGRARHRPPRDMHLAKEDLSVLSASREPGELCRHLEAELVALKRQVQSAKQANSRLKVQLQAGVEAYRPPELVMKLNPRWTVEEQLLTVQGIRRYGLNFQAITEVTGTKSTAQVKTFFLNYRRRFNLDEVLMEWEAEQGSVPGAESMGLQDGVGGTTAENERTRSIGDQVHSTGIPYQSVPSIPTVVQTSACDSVIPSVNPPPPPLRPAPPTTPAFILRQPPPLQPQPPNVPSLNRPSLPCLTSSRTLTPSHPGLTPPPPLFRPGASALQPCPPSPPPAPPPPVPEPSGSVMESDSCAK